MKIGIACYPTYGGSGVVATELGKNLARRGHEVHFFSYALPYRLNEFLENIFFHEVEVPQYPLFKYPPYALSLATKMAEIAVHEKLDFIHVHYAIPHAISAYLSREMIADQHTVRIITTLHGTDITLVGVDPSFMRITRFGINRSDAVTAVSQFLKEETERTFEPKVPIHVIHNFIEEHPLQEQVCGHLKERLAPHGEPILVHLSNFRPVKRVLDVLEIAARVRRKLAVKLLFIGDGPDRSLAEQKARELKMEQNVIFLGKQENIYPFLTIGDVFIMPSALESFGLAALEAMSCGVPCVTSRVGGLKEIMRDGITGFTAEVGDVETMSEHVLHILQNPDLKQRLSRSAREYAFDNFHVDRIIPQYLALYESLQS
ncbi:MAG: N-acetyl-alpha-D-glucosaminyl L-malate synthase BshA [Calditrichaeota bacterium]|nr:N-acetyl-alpha-D-glucosaminyl L-malate synthase BshA [Calditrichota bacterium]